MEKKEQIIVLQRQIRRLDAKVLALKIMRFTDEDYFETAYEALKKGDKNEFMRICKALDVPEPICQKLWECWMDILSSGTPGWVS